MKSNAFTKFAQAEQTEITLLDKDIGQKRDKLKQTQELVLFSIVNCCFSFQF